MKKSYSLNAIVVLWSLLNILPIILNIQIALKSMKKSKMNTILSVSNVEKFLKKIRLNSLVFYFFRNKNMNREKRLKIIEKISSKLLDHISAEMRERDQDELLSHIFYEVDVILGVAINSYSTYEYHELLKGNKVP